MDVLCIGRIAVDEYYRGGEFLGRYPGGSAYNVAWWFERGGHESALASTLGADFPVECDVDTSLCVRTDAGSPVVRVELSEEGKRETADVTEGGYRPAQLPDPTGSYDCVFLTSQQRPYVDLFERVEAETKTWTPGKMVEEYDAASLGAGLETADHVLMNDEEADAVESTLSRSLGSLPTDFSLETLVRTSSDEVTVHGRDGEHTFEVDTVPPVDATGAGDAFASEYLEAIRDGTLEAGVAAGIDRARETVGQLGARPGALD